MRRALLSAIAVAALAGSAPGGVFCERWAGESAPATHPDTLKIVPGQPMRLVFDLSALPKGAKVLHASLHCFTRDDRQPAEPVQLLVADDAGGPASGAAPLKLEAPWYRSFDATAPVRAWAGDAKANHGLAVARFDGLDARRTYLDVRYEAASGAGEPPPQVTGLNALHHDGQTFLWWKEIPAFQPPAGTTIWIEQLGEKDTVTAKGPGKGWGGYDRVPAVTLKTIRDLQGVVAKGVQLHRVRKVPQVGYRVYRHDEPITAANLHRAERLAEVPALSAYDLNMKVVSYRGEYHDMKEVGGSLIPTLPVADARNVLPGEALYVHTLTRPGRSWYAVTAVSDGTENLGAVGPPNSLAAPVAERTEPAKPVFRFLLKDQYRTFPERWYILYAAPPLANRPYREFRVLAALPEKLKPPHPLSISGYTSGYVSMFEWRASREALSLRVEYHTPWGEDGGLCYNAGLGTLRGASECKVDYFPARYLNHLIGWAKQTWPVDAGRVSGGPLHFAVRHPESTGMVYVGNYTYDYDFRWGGMPAALPVYAGPKDLAVTTDGHKAWDVLNVGWYLRNHVGRDVPFLHCVSGTGKDSGHTSEFGWQDDPRGWAALRDARQPFCAFWSCSASGELSDLIRSMRWDRSIPAFSNCSLDDNPGCGDPAHGDYYGQINGYLFWRHDDVVDETDRWEMTVFLIGAAPEDACTVDVTPRHCRKFRPRPGEKLTWTNTPLAGGKATTGSVETDKWGLATLRGAIVTKGRNRIRISR